MNLDFINALLEIEKEKGISKDIIFDALESALISSYKKNFGTSQNVEIDMDRNTGEVKVFAVKEVVDEIENENLEINLDEAKLDPKHEIET